MYVSVANIKQEIDFSLELFGGRGHLGIQKSTSVKLEEKHVTYFNKSTIPLI